MDNKKPTSVRLTPELKAELETIAKEQSRSVSNLIEYIVKEYVKSYNKEN
jgi:predicted DNA-binding protein